MILSVEVRGYQSWCQSHFSYSHLIQNCRRSWPNDAGEHSSKSERVLLQHWILPSTFDVLLSAQFREWILWSVWSSSRSSTRVGLVLKGTKRATSKCFEIRCCRPKIREMMKENPKSPSKSERLRSLWTWFVCCTWRNCGVAGFLDSNVSFSSSRNTWSTFSLCIA